MGNWHACVRRDSLADGVRAARHDCCWRFVGYGLGDGCLVRAEAPMTRTLITLTLTFGAPGAVMVAGVFTIVWLAMGAV